MRSRMAVSLVLAALGALPSGVAKAADGAALYQANCAKCHGPGGKADTAAGRALKTPSLLDPKLAGADATPQIVQRVRENAKHKQVSASLDDADLAAIAEFVRTLAAGAGG